MLEIKRVINLKISLKKFELQDITFFEVLKQNCDIQSALGIARN